MDVKIIFLAMGCFFFILSMSAINDFNKYMLRFISGTVCYCIAICSIFSNSPIIFFLVYSLTVSAGVLFVIFAVMRADEKRRFKYF